MCVLLVCTALRGQKQNDGQEKDSREGESGWTGGREGVYREAERGEGGIKGDGFTKSSYQVIILLSLPLYFRIVLSPLERQPVFPVAEQQKNYPKVTRDDG